MSKFLFSNIKNVMTKRVISWLLIVSMVFTSGGMVTFAEALGNVAYSCQELGIRS